MIKKGIHLDVTGGIHTNLDVENTKTGKTTHIGTDAEGKAGANIKKGEVTTHTQTKVKENAFTKILKGKDPRNKVNQLQISKTTNKDTKINFSKGQKIEHYSTILKSQHNVNGNKQNNIIKTENNKISTINRNKNVSTNRNTKTNQKNPVNNKTIQRTTQKVINKVRSSHIRKNAIFKRTSKK